MYLSPKRRICRLALTASLDSPPSRGLALVPTLRQLSSRLDGAPQRHGGRSTAHHRIDDCKALVRLGYRGVDRVGENERVEKASAIGLARRLRRERLGAQSSLLMIMIATIMRANCCYEGA